MWKRILGILLIVYGVANISLCFALDAIAGFYFSIGLILFGIPLLKDSIMARFRGNLTLGKWVFLWFGEFMAILLFSYPPYETMTGLPPEARSGAYAWIIPLWIGCWWLLSAKKRSHWWVVFCLLGPFGIIPPLVLRPKSGNWQVFLASNESSEGEPRE